MGNSLGRYVNVHTASVQTSKPPSATHFRGVALGLNDLVGQGTELITYACIYASASYFTESVQDRYMTSSVPYRIRLIFEPTAHAPRTWMLSCTGSGEACIITVSGTNDYVSASADLQTYTIFQTPSATSGAIDSYLEYTFANPPSGSAISEFRSPFSIQVVENPRLVISGGVEDTSFAGGRPLYDTGQNQQESMGGISRALPLAMVNTRRNGLFAWFMPYSSGSSVIETFAYRSQGSTVRSFFGAGEEPLIQPRKIYRNQLSASVTCYFYIWASGRCTGSVVVSDRSFPSLSATILFSGTTVQPSPYWISGTIPLRCDDYSQMAGLPLTSSYLKIQTVTESSKSLFISSIIVAESWKTV